MPIGEMLRRHTSKEITEMIAFGNIEPYGAQIEDLRAALAATVLVNQNRREGASPVGPYQFYPHYAEELKRKDEDSREVLKEPMQMDESSRLRAIFGGVATVKRKKPKGKNGH